MCTTPLSPFQEPIASLDMTLAAICFVQLKAGKGSDRLAVAAGLLAGLAYLTTEAGSLILPVLIAYGIVMRYDLRTEFSAATGFLFILLLETLHSCYQYGQPFARFTATVDRYSLEPMVVAANADLFDRLPKAYPRYFIWPNEDFGAWGLVFLAGIGLALRRFRESALPLLWSGVLASVLQLRQCKIGSPRGAARRNALDHDCSSAFVHPHRATCCCFVARRRSRARRDRLGGLARENTRDCRWSLPDRHRSGGLGCGDEPRIAGCRYPKPRKPLPNT